jgi:hypothetical protein
VSGWKGSEMKLLKENRAVQSFMKLVVQVVVAGSMPRSRRVTAARVGSRWSKKRKMSKSKTQPMWCVRHAT